jgi:aspartate kinase
MKIMKFGGTSVGKPARMAQVMELITKDEEPKVVVLSALSGTTNALVAIGDAMASSNKQHAKELIDTLSAHYVEFVNVLLKSKTTNQKGLKVVEEHFEFLYIILKISFNDALNKDILAQGELLSTKLFCLFLEENSVDHLFLPALDFMMIDSNDEPQVISIREKISKVLSQHQDKKLFITQGYICRNAKGEVDNLKRGGSDYSASLIAAAVNASVCEIWTDIDGMHNNDPRIVKTTRAIEQLSFDEAAELAYFGAKILHPASIWPAQQYNIPVKLLNTMQPDAKGTIISKDAESDGVKAIAAKDGIVMIKIKSSRMFLAYGFLRKIFEVFEKYKTSIDMITTSEVAVSVTIDNTMYLDEITKELSPLGELEIIRNRTIVSLVGNKLTQDKWLLGKLFNALSELEIDMISYGGSNHNVSILVPTEVKNDTLRLLNKDIFGLD